jgi:hypothetical protein
MQALQISMEEFDIANKEGKLIITAEDIKYWFKLKIISKLQVVYLGLKIWYPRATAKVDIDEFCEEFGIEETDFIKCLADLTKKGGLYEEKPKRYVQLNLFQKQETDQ